MSMAVAEKSTGTLNSRWLKDRFALELLDLDLTTASESKFAAFVKTCKATPVVVVRNQALDAKGVLDVASRLGRISAQHRVGPHPEFPGISILSNKKIDGKLIGVRDAGRSWHTDGTTYEKLGLRTLLYGVECPPEGSDTLIADAAAAFEALPTDRQQELEKLNIIHNRAVLIAKYNRAALSPEDLATMKDVIHPIVVRSQVDGRKAMFLTNGSTKAVQGMPEEEGLALVQELIEHCIQDRFVYAHKWQPGDALIWNNVGTLHKATLYDEDKYIRLVYRAWIRPFDVVNQTSLAEERMPLH